MNKCMCIPAHDTPTNTHTHTHTHTHMRTTFMPFQLNKDKSSKYGKKCQDFVDQPDDMIGQMGKIFNVRLNVESTSEGLVHSDVFHIDAEEMMRHFAIFSIFAILPFTFDSLCQSDRVSASSHYHTCQFG